MRLSQLHLPQERDLEPELEALGLRDSEQLLVLAFATAEVDLTRLQKRLVRALPRAALVGVTTGGSIAQGHIHDQGTLLVFLHFESTRVHVTWVDRAEADTDFEFGHRLGKRFMAREEPRAALLWVSGLECNADALLAGITRTTAGCPLFGAMAADASRYEHTAVFSKDRVFEAGAAAVALHGAHLRVEAFHALDWVALGKPLRVTAAQGNRVETLDDTPALRVVQRYLGKDIEERLVRLSSQFPLIVERRGQAVARRCVGTAPNGALRYSGSFSTGDRVRFGLGNLNKALESVREIQARLAEAAPEGILLLPSAARRRLMRACSELEVHGYPDIAPAAGMFNFGVFYSRDGQSEFSNNLLCALGLAETPRAPRAAAGGPGLSGTDAESDSTTQTELRAITQLALAASRDLEHINDSLEQLATTDPLTEVYNRRKIQAVMEHELARTRRYGAPAAVLMIDLDNFKAINDRYGHDMGDMILRSVANAIREHLRTTDAFGRWGGEEFVVVCPDTTLEEGVRLAERIRRFVEETHRDTGNDITVSVGVTAPARDDDLRSLLRRADRALYAAKGGGRNSVCRITPRRRG